MARGWESKSVEAQQDEAARGQSARPPLTAAQREAADRRRTLELARARISADLHRATSPVHRRMLEQALADLERRMAELDG